MKLVLLLLMFMSSICQVNGYALVQCRPGWYQCGFHCYNAWPRSELRLTFDDAEAHCRGFSNSNGTGHLVSVLNAEENELVLTLAKASGVKLGFWIGLTDVKIEGGYMILKMKVVGAFE